ncbi:MAG: PQQ-dependent sugar dehydrogenase [Proteobacteria bacterium]|nr:PQQ-dependent sugar dehydrogenase [Pseudomonadota bacterium]
MAIPASTRKNFVRSTTVLLRLLQPAFAAGVVLAPVLLLTAVCAQALDEPQVVATERAKVQLEVITDGLDHPWGLAFLPDGRALVTERPGRLRIVDRTGKVGEPLAGVPIVDAVGQGGLLDVTLDPEFARNQRIYLSFAEPRGDGMNGTSVARAKLGPKGLEDVSVIFRQQPAMKGGHHFGSRLVFGRDGNLFVTLGDRNSGRDKVQLLDNHVGKVVRIDRDGNAPADNPYLKQAGALPELWSIGHRNIQGAALDPATGELWTNEHGPKGGDEMNRTLGGRNYGWPLVTYGMEYSGKPVSNKTEAPGLEAPAHYWVPSIATSGLAFYTGTAIPAWKGSVFVGGLKSGDLSRLEMRDGRVVGEERLFGEAIKRRIRTVVNGPDGALYLLTDESEGQLIRVTAAK